jgi:hypothetical protein
MVLVMLILLNKQREASQAIQQLHAEYNALSRNFDKREKLA